MTDYNALRERALTQLRFSDIRTVSRIYVAWSEAVDKLNSGDHIRIETRVYRIIGRNETWREGQTFPPTIEFRVVPVGLPDPSQA